MTGETLDELRRRNYEIAEAVAPGWERRRPFIEQVTAPVREWMIRELAPRSGDTVLELAAGAGDTGFEAAAAVGEGGRLVSTDFSPAMVEVGRRRGAELGMGNVDHRVIDAQRIDLDADSVDGVLCRFGYMLMPEPAVALSETRRVLRPGGRLALAVWGPPDRNPNFATVGMTLVQTGHMPPPDPEGPGVFAMGSEERTRAMLQDAGFEDVRAEEVPVSFRFRDIDEYLEVTTDTAGPMAIVLRELSDAELQEVRGRLEAGFAPFATDNGYEIPGLALCAVAS
jgi:ubiquinone/menaquinone biosynthesis C-methylase UbiE